MFKGRPACATWNEADDTRARSGRRCGKRILINECEASEGCKASGIECPGMFGALIKRQWTAVSRNDLYMYPRNLELLAWLGSRLAP